MHQNLIFHLENEVPQKTCIFKLYPFFLEKSKTYYERTKKLHIQLNLQINYSPYLLDNCMPLETYL